MNFQSVIQRTLISNEIVGVKLHKNVIDLL